MTAVGLITLARVYFCCSPCATSGYHADNLLGLDGFLSKQARRILCFIATNNSFAWTRDILEQACGWSVCDELIRHICYREGSRIEQWLDFTEKPYQVFCDAQGHVEVEIDAAKVNTTDGWRDVKICIFAKREPGEKATPEQWAKRDLPAPEARMAFARIEEAEDFGPRCADWAQRLQVIDTNQVSVLADGAEWIWNLSAKHFPGAFEVLDVYHGLERLGTAARQIHTEGDKAQTWQDDALMELLRDGWAGLCDKVAKTFQEQGEAAREATEGLIGYFAKYTGRLNYCLRLYTGRTIGSGMVEGAAKNMIGKRLKQTKALWKVKNVERMAVLCTSHYSETRPLYWTAA
jgi:hypothetical protein